MKFPAYSSGPADIAVGVAERSRSPRKWAERRTAVLTTAVIAVFLCTVALYFHPVIRSKTADSLMVGDCCDPNLCSKYALEACNSNKQSSSGSEKHRWKLRDQIKSLSFTNDGSSGSGSNGGGAGGGEALSGVDRRHPGAAEAAAALGLHLVSGGGSSPLRSYYGEQRDQEQQQQQQQQQDSNSGEGAPPATVGLLTPGGNRHMGALRAAEAFGLHVTNLGGNGAYSNGNAQADVSADGEARTEKLLQTTELTDVFSAPLDVFSGALEKAVRQGENGIANPDMPPASRSLGSGEALSNTRYAHPPYGTDFNTRAVPTMPGGGVNVAAQNTIPEGAQEWRGAQIDTHVSPTMPAYSGGVHVVANEAGQYTNVNMFVKPKYGTSIGMRGRVGRGGNLQFGGNLDANGHVIQRNTAEGPDQVCIACICSQICVSYLCTKTWMCVSHVCADVHVVCLHSYVCRMCAPRYVSDCTHLGSTSGMHVLFHVVCSNVG
jgi:hypothetical protein